MIINEADRQYLNLFDGCGAAVTMIYDKSSKEKNQILKSISENDMVTPCFFYDESSKHDPTPQGAVGISYLSAAQLAQSIFTNKPPRLTQDPPNNKGQSQRNQNSQSQMTRIHSQSQIDSTIKINSRPKQINQSVPYPIPNIRAIENPNNRVKDNFINDNTHVKVNLTERTCVQPVPLSLSLTGAFSHSPGIDIFLYL
jgi:hypothetical protein